MDVTRKYKCALRYKVRKCAKCGRIISIGDQVVAYCGVEHKQYGLVQKAYARTIRFHPNCDPDWN